MTTTKFKEIEEAALELDEVHRSLLAELLLNSIEGDTDESTEQAWLKEITRREEELKSGKVATIPAEQVIAEARNLLKK